MKIDLRLFTILVAEDNYLVAEEIKRQLKKLGYSEILEASSGAEAVELTCRERPDLVLMDIEMPGMSGLAATEEILKKCPTPVVILTAYETDDLVEQAGALGVSAYLTKPPRPEEINRAIIIAVARHKDLMELKRLNKELKESLEEIKVLRGFLPICSSCKKIRDDKGCWNQIETYISTHSDAKFSHGICPDCAQILYPDLFPNTGQTKD